jgi:hypothetical protein
MQPSCQRKNIDPEPQDNVQHKPYVIDIIWYADNIHYDKLCKIYPTYVISSSCAWSPLPVGSEGRGGESGGRRL